MTSLTSELFPLSFEAGINRNISAGLAMNSYVDGDKIRWEDGSLAKIGGCQPESVSGALRGTCRAILPWRSLQTTLHVAFGTSSMLAVSTGGRYYSITPVRLTRTETNPFTTVSGLTTVTVTIGTTHDAQVGDFVAFDTSVTYNGITFFGEYPITELTTATSVKINTSQIASGSGTGGGAGVVIKFLIYNGFEDTGASGFGFGAGYYGVGTYGTPRTEAPTSEARVWCLQTWGEDLLALPIGGALYAWDTTAGVANRAQVVATAPDRNNFMIVASTFRQCILFGTKTISGDFDPLLLRWSATENYTNYNPVGSNAGEYRLSKGSKIISAIETSNGEIIVFTDAAVYKLVPVSSEDVYSLVLVTDSVGILSPLGRVEFDGKVMFVSKDGWFIYAGSVNPVPSTLDRFYFDPQKDGYYNTEQKVKIHMGLNRARREIWTFLPDKSNREVNRYVIFNIDLGIWYDGTWERLAWADNGILTRPYAIDRANKLVIHEQGLNDDNIPLSSFIQSGLTEINKGDTLQSVEGFYYDGSINSTCSVTLKARKHYIDNEEQVKTREYSPTDKFKNFRIRGRYLSYRWECNTFNGYFEFGRVKVRLKPSGKR